MRWIDILFLSQRRRKTCEKYIIGMHSKFNIIRFKTKRKSAKQILSLLNKKYKSYVLLQDTACIQNHYQSCYFDRIIPNNFTHIIIQRTKYYMIYFEKMHIILIDRYCSDKNIISIEFYKIIAVMSRSFHVS